MTTSSSKSVRDCNMELSTCVEWHPFSLLHNRDISIGWVDDVSKVKDLAIVYLGVLLRGLLQHLLFKTINLKVIIFNCFYDYIFIFTCSYSILNLRKWVFILVKLSMYIFLLASTKQWLVQCTFSHRFWRFI